MASRSNTAPEREPLFSVGPYRRVVAASIERVWENVLDWEHLPHLHHDSFASLRLLSADADGWRAIVTTVRELGAAESEIEVVLDRPQSSYVTRTLAGAGEGTEITTVLEPMGSSTRITVDFLVPGVSEQHAELIGVYYRKLYARLWDQDEDMMIGRQRALDRAASRGARVPDARRAPVPLGNADELRARLPLRIEIADRMFQIVAVDGEILVHSATCPHMGGPLAVRVERDGCLVCPWHGFRFDARTGRSTEGRVLRLAPAPRVEIDPQTGEALLRWGA
jgi:nitrite reductase/ring-hydroxylating ferredoxin subunit